LIWNSQRLISLDRDTPAIRRKTLGGGIFSGHSSFCSKDAAPPIDPKQLGELASARQSLISCNRIALLVFELIKSA
jgi:hypothetical protein